MDILESYFAIVITVSVSAFVGGMPRGLIMQQS
jgi:hypothetical protein